MRIIEGILRKVIVISTSARATRSGFQGMKLGAIALVGDGFGASGRVVKSPQFAICAFTDWRETLSIASVMDVF